MYHINFICKRQNMRAIKENIFLTWLRKKKVFPHDVMQPHRMMWPFNTAREWHKNTECTLLLVWGACRIERERFVLKKTFISHGHTETWEPCSGIDLLCSTRYQNWSFLVSQDSKSMWMHNLNDGKKKLLRIHLQSSLCGRGLRLCVIIYEN